MLTVYQTAAVFQLCAGAWAVACRQHDYAQDTGNAADYGVAPPRKSVTSCFEDEGRPLADSLKDFLGHNIFTHKSGEPVPSVTMCTHVHRIDPIWVFWLNSSKFAAFSPAEMSSYPRSFRSCALALVLLRDRGSGSALSTLGHNMFAELLEVLAELALEDCKGNAELAANYLSHHKLELTGLWNRFVSTHASSGGLPDMQFSSYAEYLIAGLPSSIL